MRSCTCGEGQAQGAYWVCEHLLADSSLSYSLDLRQTAGAPPVSVSHDKPALLCTACAEDADQAHREAALRAACAACVEQVWGEGDWRDGARAFVGEGAARVAQPPRLSLRAEEVMVRGDATLQSAAWVQVAPVKAAGRPVWVALASDLSLWWLDLHSEEATPLGALSLPAGLSAWTPPLTLACAEDGATVAVAEQRGRYGVVLAVDWAQPGSPALRLVASLDRGDYHEAHCASSLAFFTHNGAPRLLYATAWNRLDVMDPRTGACVTARDIAPYEDNVRPAHYLDYFHCRVDVSPDGQHVMDAGWVWAPIGVVRAWSLNDWLERNLFEAEDGPSVRGFAPRGYFWDGPGCWLDSRRVALWGFGSDDEHLIPSVWVFDAIEGRALGWFYGPPRGTLYADGVLFVVSDAGLSVWDPDTGARLFRAADVHPIDYHPTARVLLERRAPSWRISRCVSTT